MWLEYALNLDSEYVSITEVPRGRSELYCPYCQGELIAKKGKVKAHHFAHLEQTCNYVQNTESVQLPMYKQFYLSVPRKYIQPLLEHWDKSTRKKPINPPNSYQLTNYNLTVYNSYAGNGRGAYEYTKLGLIVVGGLSLDLFNKIQEPILIDKLTYYEQDIIQAKETNSIDLKDKITDYEIYRNQYRYILRASLYFLEITTELDVFYKIGITTRQLAQRIAEIKQELSQFFPSVSIKGLGFWKHRGNVEHYFKHRYRKYRYSLANYTEYFKFEDIKPILRDLRRMKPK